MAKEHEARKRAKKRISDSSSSSFTFSRVLPFSWFGKLTSSASSSKPRRQSDPGEVVAAMPSTRSPTDPTPRFASDRFLQSPVIEEAPRRLYLREEAEYRARVARFATGRWAISSSPSVTSSPSPVVLQRGRRNRAPGARLPAAISGHRSVCTGGGGFPRAIRRAQGMGYCLPRRSICEKVRQRPKVKVRSSRPVAVRAEVERTRAAAGRGRIGAVRGGDVLARSAAGLQEIDGGDDMAEGNWAAGGARDLAYLCLNSDEHHDVIFQVFRQVWFELNRERLVAECDRQRQRTHCNVNKF